MITDTQKRKNVETKTEPIKTAKYHINSEHITHITQILRNMYSDPKLAVVREYVCNAIDAHRSAKQTKRVQVTLPSFNSPTLVIRDFGGGLSIEDAESLLYGYGSSGDEKRVSNEQIGGFGIGCKCAFALTDSFSYTVWHGGKKQEWSCFLDDNDAGAAQLLSHESDADEPGIRVMIPVNAADAKRYAQLLQKTFLHWPESERPDVEGISDFKWDDPPGIWLTNELEVDLDGQKLPAELQIKQSRDRVGPQVIMGNIAYPVDETQVHSPRNDLADSTHGTYIDQLWGRSILRVPIGFVQLAPSREALQYSAKTKAVLQGVYKTTFSPEFAENFLKEVIKSSKNTRAVGLALQQARAPVPKAFCNRLTSAYQMELRHGTYDLAYRGAYYMGQSGTTFQERVEKNAGGADCRNWYFDCNTFLVGVVVPDKTTQADCRELVGKAYATWASENASKLEMDTYASEHVNVLVIKNPSLSEMLWLKDGSCHTMYTLEDLDNDVDVDKWILARRTRNTRSPCGYSNNTYKQHSRKFVSLKTDKLGNSTRSTWWNPCSAKDIKGGIYIPISGFRAKGYPDTSETSDIQHTAAGFKSLLKRPLREKLLPRLDNLLGVRIGKDLESVQKVHEFMEYNDYIDYCLKKDIKSGDVNPKHLARLLHERINSTVQQAGLAWASRQVHNTMAELGRHPQLTNTYAGKYARKWADAADNASKRTREWAELLPYAYGTITSRRDRNWQEKTVTPRLVACGVIPKGVNWGGWIIPQKDGKGNPIATHLQELHALVNKYPFLGTVMCVPREDHHKVPLHDEPNPCTRKRIHLELENLVTTEALYTWVQAADKEIKRKENI